MTLMPMEISKRFKFEAAHYLPNVHPGHKCGRMHGHSYSVGVHVVGEVGERTGWVVDFADLATAWLPLHALLDHRLLNEVPGLENPTSENLAAWVWARLIDGGLTGLSMVTVRETCTSGCHYRGP